MIKQQWKIPWLYNIYVAWYSELFYILEEKKKVIRKTNEPILQQHPNFLYLSLA